MEGEEMSAGDAEEAILYLREGDGNKEMRMIKAIEVNRQRVVIFGLRGLFGTIREQKGFVSW